MWILNHINCHQYQSNKTVNHIAFLSFSVLLMHIMMSFNFVNGYIHSWNLWCMIFNQKQLNKKSAVEFVFTCIQLKKHMPTYLFKNNIWVAFGEIYQLDYLFIWTLHSIVTKTIITSSPKNLCLIVSKVLFLASTTSPQQNTSICKNNKHFLNIHWLFFKFLPFICISFFLIAWLHIFLNLLINHSKSTFTILQIYKPMSHTGAND